MSVAQSPSTGLPNSALAGSDKAEPAIVLDLTRVDDLFIAPTCNPFSAREIDVLGQSGIDFLRRHFRRRWPRHAGVREVVIRLPQALQPPTPGEQAALQRKVQAGMAAYCGQQVPARRTALKLVFLNARRELLIAFVVTLVAIGALLLAIGGFVIPWLANVQYLLTIMAVFAASLAIWDALESLFFDWVPYVIENGADRWIADLEVRLEFEPPPPAAAAATPPATP